MDLTGTQVHASVTRHKYNRLRHTKILNGYDNFNTSVVIELLMSPTNFGGSYVQFHVMTLKASRVVSRIFLNNNNTTVLPTLFVTYIRESYKLLLSQIE